MKKGHSRIATPLRVLVDAGAGLNGKIFKEMAGWEEKQIKDWGAGYGQICCIV